MPLTKLWTSASFDFDPSSHRAMIVVHHGGAWWYTETEGTSRACL